MRGGEKRKWGFVGLWGVGNENCGRMRDKEEEFGFITFFL